MTINRKQRNFLLLCGAIVVAYYVERSIEDSARQAAYYRQQAIRAAQLRAFAKAHPPAPPRAPAAAPVKGATAGTPAGAPAPGRTPVAPTPLPGIWRGRTAIAGRGICTLTVELHEGDPGRFTGYSTLACGNFGPLMSKEDRNPAAATLNRMSPAGAILSGAMENGSIRFHVDKTVGTNSNGCAATSLTLTPFGTNQLAAEWQEGGCEGGHIILQKARG